MLPYLPGTTWEVMSLTTLRNSLLTTGYFADVAVQCGDRA